MKEKSELRELIEKISSAASPVGMDAVYVHALILDQLAEITLRLESVEKRLAQLEQSPDPKRD